MAKLKECATCQQSLSLVEFASFFDKGRNRLRYRRECKECYKQNLRTRRLNRKAIPPPPALASAPPPEAVEEKEPNTDALLESYKNASKLTTLQRQHTALLQRLHDAENTIDILTSLHTRQQPPAVKATGASHGKRQATAVVLASDWHVEEFVDAEKVNGRNAYDLGIAEKRIHRFVAGIEWLLDLHREKFEIQDLILWLGGDLMSGYIHEELVEGNQLSPTETLLWLQAELTGVIRKLQQIAGLKKITIPCSYGNHGRTTARTRIQTGAENSFEWLLYRQLIHTFQNSQQYGAEVEIIAPKSQLLYLDVYDTRLRFTHGDALRFQGGVGGLTIPISKAIANWNVGNRADVTCMGHWHQLLTLPNAVVNGSLIGYSPYSVRIAAPFEVPQQAFFLVDSKRGHTAHFPIWVDDGETK